MRSSMRCLRRLASMRASRASSGGPAREPPGAPATPKELIVCLDGLKQRGHAAQLAVPRLAGRPELAQQLQALAAIARHYQARLSIRSRADHTPEGLDLIAL